MTLNPPDGHRVFALLKTVQFDVRFEEDAFVIRLELYEDASDGGRFRADIWRTELYHIQSTFPRDEAQRPLHGASDERILVDWSSYLKNRYRDFRARNADVALEIVLADIRATVKRFGGD